MNGQKPEALRLADYFDRFEKSSHRTEDGEPLHVAAAAELRRLHEVNAELVEALRQLIDDIDSEAFLFDGGCGVSEVSREQALAAIAKATGEQQ
jgi:hypothetical protein